MNGRIVGSRPRPIKDTGSCDGGHRGRRAWTAVDAIGIPIRVCEFCVEMATRKRKKSRAATVENVLFSIRFGGHPMSGREIAVDIHELQQGKSVEQKVLQKVRKRIRELRNAGLIEPDGRVLFGDRTGAASLRYVPTDAGIAEMDSWRSGDEDDVEYDTGDDTEPGDKPGKPLAEFW